MFQLYMCTHIMSKLGYHNGCYDINFKPCILRPQALNPSSKSLAIKLIFSKSRGKGSQMIQGTKNTEFSSSIQKLCLFSSFLFSSSKSIFGGRRQTRDPWETLQAWFNHWASLRGHWLLARVQAGLMAARR